MPEFIPGLELSRRFYFEAVEPVIRGAYPDLKFSAARIGEGLDVLGFDTPMSMDHDWGPQVHIFLAQEDLFAYIRPLGSAFRSALPRTFLGFPTFFGEHEDGTAHMAVEGGGQPKVDIGTFESFLDGYLGFRPEGTTRPEQWLSTPEQKLLGMTSGAVFRDDLGIEGVRDRLRYFPDDIWHYLLASNWDRIGEEEHLVGRAGYVGDEIGAQIIAARLVRDMMRMGFLMERRYAPYPKWLGTAYRELPCAQEMEPHFRAVLDARGWEARDTALAKALEATARHHNRLKLTAPITETCAPFHGRPFRVLQHHAQVSDRLAERIADPEVRALAARRRIGSVDTFSDSTDLLCDETRRETIQSLYLDQAPNVPMKL